jgi:hypothetical protein
MINTIFYTFLGIPSGYFISILINDYYNMLYNRHISNTAKYSIITTITVLSFLKGYTGNDLVTNIYK